jgi:VCBS repeat-containing protein
VTTNEVQNFLATDTSCATARFNLFTITEGTTVTLNDAGQWNYSIYAQTSAVNTDPDNADELVEVGRVKVIDPTASTDVTYTANDGEIDVQYDPE